MLQENISGNYRNDPKFLDKRVWANSAEPDQTAPLDQGFHCLLFHLHLFDNILWPL